MDFTFTEKADYEKGFASIYQTQIAPILKEMETERIRLVRRAKNWVYFVLGSAGILALLAIIYVHPALAILPIFFGAGIVFFTYDSEGRELTDRLTDLVSPLICDFLGDIIHQKEAPSDFFNISHCRDLHVLPNSDYVNNDHAINGCWRGVKYRLAETVATTSDGIPTAIGKLPIYSMVWSWRSIVRSI